MDLKSSSAQEASSFQRVGESLRSTCFLSFSLSLLSIAHPTFERLIYGPAVHYGLCILVSAQHYQQVAHHGGLALFVEIDHISLRLSFRERHSPPFPPHLLRSSDVLQLWQMPAASRNIAAAISGAYAKCVILASIISSPAILTLA